jgi:hypothetical protein
MNTYKYGYALDETNRIVGLIGDPEPNIPFIEINIPMEEFKVGEYQLLDGVLTFVGLKQSEINRIKIEEHEAQIINSKKELEKTDYKIIKCYEAQLLGEEMPYDIQELLNQRQVWRNQINTSEETISSLQNN